MNIELQKSLISLRERDKVLRSKILAEGTLYDGYDPRLESLHTDNGEKLSEIIEKYGWPGKSLVGKDGADAAFILAQHSISRPGLQRKFLVYMKKAVATGEVTPLQVACLEDRILFNEGKPLKYGLLFDWDDTGNLFANVDDVTLANERRAKLGLKTINEEIEIHRELINKEGGGPPSDYKRHKELEAEWAKRVGWR